MVRNSLAQSNGSNVSSMIRNSSVQSNGTTGSSMIRNSSAQSNGSNGHAGSGIDDSKAQVKGVMSYASMATASSLRKLRQGRGRANQNAL